MQGKNELTRNLFISSCVLDKFYEYETIRHQIAHQENKDFMPINIVYQPIYDENIPVPCFFTNKIYLAYRSYKGRFDKGKERICHRVVKQCYYCKNVFAKNDESLKKHLQVCAAKEGVTYSFDNGQIISFQDNFKSLGDVLFTVYFDFDNVDMSQEFKNFMSEELQDCY